MKFVKNYSNFLNEELNVLKGPTDKETFEISPLKRIKLINNLKLDDKFYPTDEEIYKEMNKLETSEKIRLCIDNKLDKKFFPTDEEILKNISPINRLKLYVENFLDEKFIPKTVEELEKALKDENVQTEFTAEQIFENPILIYSYIDYSSDEMKYPYCPIIHEIDNLLCYTGLKINVKNRKIKKIN
jgi:hypothetical protein